MTPEGAILKAVLDYLAARKILAFRMNTGAMSGEHNGKRWFMRFGAQGMADVLAFPHVWREDNADMLIIAPLWLEVKTAKGKQSPAQKEFQAMVEADGHQYAVVRSVEDLIEALK